MIPALLGRGKGRRRNPSGGITVPVDMIEMPNVLFDTSMGEGVDENGRTNLPVGPGARIIRYGPGGDDSHDGMTHATRLLTGSAAAALLRDDYPDRIQVPFNADLTGQTLPNLNFRGGGRSRRYPWVFESYDPADEDNQAKWGDPPTEAAYPEYQGDSSQNWFQGGTQQRYLAVRGICYNPSVTSGQGIGCNTAGDGLLFENLILHFAGIGGGGYGNEGNDELFSSWWVLRCIAAHNTHSLDTGTAGSIFYFSGCDSLTIECSQLAEAGYRSRAERHNAISAGGGVQRRHIMYQQDGTKVLLRHNKMLSSCADAGTHRGDLYDYGNVKMDNPINGGFGDGSGFNTNIHTRMGYNVASQYNVLGGSDAYVTDSGAKGWLIGACGTADGSGARNNIAIDNYWRADGQTIIFNPKTFLYDAAPWNEVDADGIPTYFDFSDNITNGWAQVPSGRIIEATSGSFNGTYTSGLSKVHYTANNNIWDGPSDGNGNVNVTTVTFSNPRTTKEEVAIAGGFDSFLALVDHCKHNPKDFQSTRIMVGATYAGYDRNWDMAAATVGISAVAGANGAATVTVSSTKDHTYSYIVAVPAGDPQPAQDRIRGARRHDWDPVRKGASARLLIKKVGSESVDLHNLRAGSYDVYVVAERFGVLTNIAKTATPLVIPAWTMVGWADNKHLPGSSSKWARSNGGLRATMTNSDGNDHVVRTLLPSNDGEIEITVVTVGTAGVIIGFTGENHSQTQWMGGGRGSGWSDVGMYWGARAGGTFTTGTHFVAGDRIRLRNLNGILTYYKNDVLIGTVDATELGPLLYVAATAGGTGTVLDITDISLWP